MDTCFYFSRSEIAGSCSESVFTFIDTAIFFSERLIPFPFPPAVCERSICSTTLPTLGNIFFNFNHSSEYVVIPQASVFFKNNTYLLVYNFGD